MIKCQKHLFDIPEDITYLNAAYMGPLTKQAAAIGRQTIDDKLKPWSIATSDFFDIPEDVYHQAAKLIEAQPSEIAIVPSVSYGLAIAAKNIKAEKGQKILVMADQFPSNVYCWKELAKETGAFIETVSWPDDNNWTAAILSAIDDNTAIVAVANAHWTNGTKIDLIAVGKKSRAVSASLVLDLTQTLGAIPFSVKEVDPDYMVTAAYKWLLGPYSFGFIYVAPRHHAGRPLEESWITRKDAHNFARLVDYKEDYQPGARRFDMGEKSNFINAPIAASSLRLINELGVENIARYLKSLTEHITKRAQAIGLNVSNSEHRAENLIGINFGDGVPDHIASTLADEKIFVSIRGDSIRISPHIYNDREDVDRLFDVLEGAL